MISCLEGLLANHGTISKEEKSPGDPTNVRQDLINKILYAFQLATAQGPMCSEPMQGVAVFIEDCKFPCRTEDEDAKRETSARLTGDVIRTVRDSIRQGFLDWSPRLLLAMYSCEIQASSKASYMFRIKNQC